MKKNKKEIQYIAISIDKLKQYSPDIPINFYIQLGAKGNEEALRYAQIFSKTSGIDYTRLARYVNKGVKELYINREDEELLNQYFLKELKEPSSTEKQIKYLLNKTDQVLTEIFEGSKLLSETAEQTKVLVKKYIQTLHTKPDQLKILLELSHHGDVLYSHSLSVAVLSLFIAKNFGEFGQDFYENLTLGALFHDVGYIKLGHLNVDSQEEEVDPKEWAKHKSHTKLGLDVVASLKDFPEDVRYIIYQHHEHMNGRGFPNQLKGDSIFILSHIVCLADEYCNLWRKAVQVEQGTASELELLKRLDAKKNYFHPQVFACFHQIFDDLKKKSKPAA